jgi:hypothetical protein
MMVDFRSGDHTYWLPDGKQLPGVTSILASLNAYPGNGFYTENSRLRGQAVHAACHLADVHCQTAETMEDVLDVLEIAPAIQPYLEGYLRFRKENRYLAIAWERPLHSARLRIAGTPDSWGKSGTEYTLVDLKSWASQGAKPKHSAEVQTAAYSIMLREHLGLPHEETINRWVVKLPGDGNYRCYPCEDPHDFSEVIWMSQIWHRWKDKGIFKFAGDPEQVEAE